jgi:hypothetical protein
MVVILVLSFFPWGGLFGTTGMDTAVSVVKNLDGSIEQLLTLSTILFAALAVVFALLNKANHTLVILALVSPVALFIYSIIQSGVDSIKSIELAFAIVVVLSTLVLLKTLGIIKLRFLK